MGSLWVGIDRFCRESCKMMDGNLRGCILNPLLRPFNYAKFCFRVLFSQTSFRLFNTSQIFKEVSSRSFRGIPSAILDATFGEIS